VRCSVRLCAVTSLVLGERARVRSLG
jgi:hypothetical protein